MPRPCRYVWVCTKRRPEGTKKGSCAEQGSEELVRALKIAAGQAKLPVRVTSSGCFDLCWVGASVAVMPDGVFYKRIGLADVPLLVSALSADAPLPEFTPLAAKLVVEADFEDPTKKDG